MTRCGTCFNLVVHSAQRLCRHTDDPQLSHIERVDEAYREPTTDPPVHIGYLACATNLIGSIISSYVLL
ncbi:hypothetical protein OIDMADRAFT_60605 [Oidiodendron maius Zn]|uniref:Uncharacterized protein n=1 Tax=Oidiodendron maius (strain Zn) TaxID=913774 RepID=A0A0C3CX46_OIDMZ|nr:hypothetical protein OIDMADRAFT_60605 [Oidiodendron maius Zn]